MIDAERAGSVQWIPFSTPELSVYKYAETRSGKVAMEMLGESDGVIVVDQSGNETRNARAGRAHGPHATQGFR